MIEVKDQIDWGNLLQSSVVRVLTERFYFLDMDAEVEEQACAEEFRVNFIRNFLNEGIGEAPSDLSRRLEIELPIVNEGEGVPDIYPVWTDMRFIAAPIATLAALFDNLSSPGFEGNIVIETEPDTKAVFRRRLSAIRLKREGEQENAKAAAMIYAAAAAFLLEENMMLLGAYLLLEESNEQ